ncbi:energy transducer TonB [Aquabacter sp. CN5-332]|uniref:energy transducer TonB n=1 Tax=Aquabacter sp. CN5-332 TaxID=3156608 RepID=UPI0032B5D74F
MDWHHEPHHGGHGNYATRWLMAGVVILALHVGAVYLSLHWPYAAESEPAAAAMMIDLAPLPVAPPSETEDVAPGPQMVQAPDPMDTPEELEEATPPPEPIVDPLLELPELPPPPPLAEALLPPPRPVEEVKEPPPPKPVEKPKPKPKASRKPAAPTTSAAPRSDAAPSNATAAPNSGASASNSAAPATWRSMLVAHLNRHKRYPAEARARREEGTARLRFSIDRSGRVVGASLAGSAGSPALDAEVLDLIRRASPVPAPPPEVAGGVITLTVPVNFSAK